MTTLLETSISDWLKIEALSEPGLYKTTFQVHHLGNIFIKSLHGGVTGATMELAAQDLTRNEVGTDVSLMITSTSVDYLRITKDVDLYARATVQRMSRRLSIVDVYCWQDDEALPVARGVITIKVDRGE